MASGDHPVYLDFVTNRLDLFNIAPGFLLAFLQFIKPIIGYNRNGNAEERNNYPYDDEPPN